jgi:hypothetical protein
MQTLIETLEKRVSEKERKEPEGYTPDAVTGAIHPISSLRSHDLLPATSMTLRR